MFLIERLKQRRSRFGDARRSEVSVQEILRLTVQPDKLFLAALFVKPQTGALSLQPDFVGTTCLITNQLKSTLNAARCCFTEGGLIALSLVSI